MQFNLRSIFMTPILTVAIIGLLTGCNAFDLKAKAKPDKAAEIKKSNSEGASSTDSNAASSDGTGTKEALLQAADIYDLYASNGSMTREELENIAKRLKSKVEEVLGMHNLDLKEIIETLYAIGTSNGSSSVSPGKIVAAVKSNIPMLVWYENTSELTEEELHNHIAELYPTAAKTAVDGLTTTLMKFDREWTGGDANGKLSRKECAIPILIMSGIAKLNFNGGLPLGLASSFNMGAETRLAIRQVENKVQQQMFGRYASNDLTQIPAVDLMLESMQTFLNLYQADKLSGMYGIKGEFLPAKLDEAIRNFAGIDIHKAKVNMTELIHLYDNPMMGGDDHGTLGALEFYNLVTDLEFGAKLMPHLMPSGDMKRLVNVTQEGLDVLTRLFPNAGSDIFLDSHIAEVKLQREEYWSALTVFNKTDFGGSNDGSINYSELTMALGYVRILDNIFALYDLDRDGKLSGDEAKPLFHAAGVENEKVVDAFFANIGLKPGSNELWTGVLLLFAKDADNKKLSPYEFYSRAVNVLPRLLKHQRL